MKRRYFGKVVEVLNEYTVVINKGSDSEVKNGDKFLIVGIGDIIKDPETGEELEQLEIVRGRATVLHVQNKISTLGSCDYEREEDRREIKKIKKVRKHVAGFPFLAQSPEEITETESIEPGEKRLKELKGVEKGDYVIKL